MKLIQILVEASNRPKVVVMAGGAGAGKSFLLDKLDLESLLQVNPDKYTEAPKEETETKKQERLEKTRKAILKYFQDNEKKLNNALEELKKEGKLSLTYATDLANREAEELKNNKQSFVWDTTASNPSKIKELINKGYDVFMVMVYTHPMISYISNFSRDRNVPSSAVFNTWRDVYQLIKDYEKMTGGNFAIMVNDRGGKYSKEIEGFNTAAKNGVSGIKDYLQRYNEENEIGASSFRKPIEMSDEEEEEFLKATQGIDWDRDSYGEDRAIKDAFVKTYRKNGAGPGADKLKKSITDYRNRKEKQKEKEEAVLKKYS